MAEEGFAKRSVEQSVSLGQGLGLARGRVPVADGFVDFAGHRGAGLAGGALALGLRRPNQSVLLPDTVDVRGMLKVVEHMIAVEPA